MTALDVAERGPEEEPHIPDEPYNGFASGEKEAMSS
jgi:hypothetical protein